MAKQEQQGETINPVALEDEYEEPVEEFLPQSELVDLDDEDDFSTPTDVPPEFLPSPTQGPEDLQESINMLSVAYALQQE
eukprot:11710548-Prorocentrum_lima.AAC.1